ncbi:MAG: aromatic ring-hydroxylating oxygenase subunit alpha [Dehalococcoidia bacterium]
MTIDHAPDTRAAAHIEPPRPDSFLHPSVYFSPAVYERELRDLFPRLWLCVADLDQLADRGDYVTDTVGDEPVVVIRGHDGLLRAFANVCPHRATTLLEGEGSCGRSIICPYHGWSFNLDGTLAGIPDRTRFATPFDPASFGMYPVRVETWERFVFVNVSGDAPPLHEYLEIVPDLLAPYHIDALHRSGTGIDDVIPVNWKVFVDNALDDYHVPIVHPDSLAPLFSSISTWLEQTGRGNTNVLYTPMSERLAARFPPLNGLSEEAERGAYTIDIFPNLTLLAFPDGNLAALRITPVSLDSTRVRLQGYTEEPMEGPDDATRGMLARMIQAEDYRITQRVQQGLRSRFYRPGPAHYLELRTQRFQSRLAALLNGGSV